MKGTKSTESKVKKEVSPKTHIEIQGARMHNLKSVDVKIPRNKLVVITGLSGSGKSSLAFDTLYAEGQRRYVESLSSYARQFLGRFNKPEVDHIRGISPAVAIEQKVISRNPRSTVGTSTEIYDYLKLLFARVGKTYSPVSGKEVKRNTVEDVLEQLSTFSDGSKAIILSPIKPPSGRAVADHINILAQQGFSRLYHHNQLLNIDDDLEINNEQDLFLVIDRIVWRKDDDDNIARIADSVESAFYEGQGECYIEVLESKSNKRLHFSNSFEMDGIEFEEPDVNFFTFNNPVGACKTCEGFGSVIGVDEDLVFPDKSISVYDGAIMCWKGDKMSKYKDDLIRNSHHFDFPVHRPINELTEEEYQLLWTGNEYFEGLNDFFAYLESKLYKIQYRVILSRYRGKTPCPDCKGTRLRKDANYVKVGGKSISELVNISIEENQKFFAQLKLTEHDQLVAKRLLLEINNRLKYLCDVGLSYLTLNRLSNTLSGGESQRINLATSLGSSLVGSMYILDEPSIGLHPRDTNRLIEVLKSLRDVGNTVIVVEHDEEVIKAADYIIDMGPMAGALGGEVVFTGVHKDFDASNKDSLTVQYMLGKMEIEIPSLRRKWQNKISIEGARENNLKNITVDFPLNTLTVVTGVSGSGKSSLVKRILFPALGKMYGGTAEKPGKHDKITGDFKAISAVEFVDQNPIGKSSRSNPVTYLKAFDEIRNMFSQQQLSKMRGYKPKHFSFNVEGGRCDECEGEGYTTVEMQFMADVHLLCESCQGKRYKEEVLEVLYREKSIWDILDLTVDEALFFFSGSNESGYEQKIIDKLQPLQDVGLGYVKLGQSSSTLSGGEAQRIKLASFLSKGTNADKTLFIFDEPTTGLHFHDVQKLLDSLNALIEKGHSILIIEHNSEVIKCADWVIDLGPEGGDKGGELLFTGTPEELIKSKESYTGRFLKDKF